VEHEVCCPEGSPFITQRHENRSDLLRRARVVDDAGNVVAVLRTDEGGGFRLTVAPPYRIVGAR
jgi:hypothetical protein